MSSGIDAISAKVKEYGMKAIVDENDRLKQELKEAQDKIGELKRKNKGLAEKYQKLKAPEAGNGGNHKKQKNSNGSSSSIAPTATATTTKDDGDKSKKTEKEKEKKPKHEESGEKTKKTEDGKTKTPSRLPPTCRICKRPLKHTDHSPCQQAKEVAKAAVANAASPPAAIQ